MADNLFLGGIDLQSLANNFSWADTSSFGDSIKTGIETTAPAFAGAALGAELLGPTGGGTGFGGGGGGVGPAALPAINANTAAEALLPGSGAGSAAFEAGLTSVPGALKQLPAINANTAEEALLPGSGAGSPAFELGARPPQILNSDPNAPALTTLSPETAVALGLDPVTLGQELGAGGISNSSISLGLDPITMGMESGGQFPQVSFGDEGGMVGDSSAFDPSDAFTARNAWQKLKGGLKEAGLSPATAAMLGISGIQALSTPKLPQAAEALQSGAIPGAAQANSVISSGGTASPAWATQKASIDATIDQQIKEQTAALVQNAINSGMGADSQVVQQQINKLKDQAETMRAQQYAQAQQQNVQTALSQLGISDQALSNVASAQFKQSDEAKAAAQQTAQNALMLQALQRGQAGATA